MKQYRVPFFDQLHAELGARGVQLRVVYSAPDARERGIGDHAELDVAYGRKVPALRLPRGAVWQGAWGELMEADLAVVEQANKHAINYPLLALARLGCKRVAFWGHGRNRQGDPRALGERVKRSTLRLADWWCAYTAGTAQYLIDRGVDGARITTVQNAIDLTTFRADLAAVDRLESRRALGLDEAAPVGLFCGALVRQKQIERLLAAADRLRTRLPGFTLLIAGAGPEEARVAAAAATRPWCRQLGTRFGADKARLFRISDVVLNPGVVGVVALDAAAAALPLITTDVAGHGPEIEYVEPGVTGLITRADDDAYASAVAALLGDPAERARMGVRAAAAAQGYSMAAMVERFASGVMRWVSA